MTRGPQAGTPSNPPAPYIILALVGLGLLMLAFTALAWERKWFNDDCFITFRYAQNLAEGHGFVWNTSPPSPRVEGSTSLGWTALNAIAIALRQHPTITSQLVGLVFGLLGLGLVYFAAWRLAELPPLWALVAPALLFAHRQYLYWSVSAMEILPASVITFGATLLFVREVQRERGHAWLSGLVFFAATIFRPEVPLFHLATGVALLAVAPSATRALRVVTSGGVHAILLGLVVVGRLAYFGKPLPNTFYVKVGGLQIDRGLEYVAQYFSHYQAALWAPLLIAGLVVLVRARSALLAACVSQIAFGLAWFIASGGGQWEFRYFVWILMPWAVLLAASIRAFARGFSPDAASPRPMRVALVAVAALLVIGSQAWTHRQPFRIWGDMMSFEELHAAAGAMLTDGRKLSEFIDREDRIAFGWAGAVPYLTRAWHFDPWGLNEPDAGSWPFDKSAPIYHQRHATWDQLRDADVMIVDLFNQFLYRQPEPVARLLPKLQPWAKPGTLVYCAEVPDPRAPWYLIFASPQPTTVVEEWIAAKGLRRIYATPLTLTRESTLVSPSAPPN